MKLRAILETETMDPDFKEPFLNGMPFDITESTFDRIVRFIYFILIFVVK